MAIPAALVVMAALVPSRAATAEQVEQVLQELPVSRVAKAVPAVLAPQETSTALAVREARVDQVAPTAVQAQVWADLAAQAVRVAPVI